jgi:DsbC/DsbD-like thiol-disulfide interchange protein
LAHGEATSGPNLEEIMTKSPRLRAVRTFLAALGAVALAGAAAQSQAHAQAPGWVELSNARARLVGGAPAADGAKSYLAGVEIALDEGWKTYWRMPGDAGVPPNFDWSGSSNVAALTVLYPAPARMSEPVAETVGYKRAVLFPVEVVPKDVSQPVHLALALEFGVCREICIPAEARLALALAPAEMAGKPSPAMLAALAQVPRPPALRHAEDPRITRASAFLEGGQPHLIVVARFPKGDRGADLFLEAPDGLYVPMARRVPNPSGAGEARPEADTGNDLVYFEVDLARRGDARELKGRTLRLTLVSDAGSSEVSWTVP